jgi:hypothetical protein
MGMHPADKRPRPRFTDARARVIRWLGGIFTRDLAIEILAAVIGAFALSWTSAAGLYVGAVLGAACGKIVQQLVRRWSTRKIWATSGALGIADLARRVLTPAGGAAGSGASSAGTAASVAVAATVAIGTIAAADRVLPDPWVPGVAPPQSETDGSPDGRTPDIVATSPSWFSTAVQYRGEDGRRVQFACPSPGEARSVWGSDIYTDDSSVCTAAVHAGLIDPREAEP